eukprot:COSAG02_NODE_39766_length_413_cov_0.764331_1_plen_20_part_01
MESTGNLDQELINACRDGNA